MSSTKVPKLSKSEKNKKSFNPMNFLMKMMDPMKVIDDREKSDISASEFWTVCKLAIEEMKKEKNIVRVPAPAVVVGDIHGHFHDLYRALSARTAEEINDPKNTTPATEQFLKQRYVFLGNYIGRGPRSVDCICLLLILKFTFPDKYILLRGSYEFPNLKHGDFMPEIGKRFKQNQDKIREKLMEVFSWMPFVAIIGQSIMCVHGGISEHLNKWKDVEKIKRPLLDPRESPLVSDLLFSDTLDYDFVHIPSNKPVFEFNDLRGISVFYNEAAVKQFCAKLNIKLIIRSNFMVNYGFRWFADKKLITIFSASGYQGESNHGAVLKINGKGKVSIVILLPMISAPHDTQEKAQNPNSENIEPSKITLG